jgi:hypothetical protein
MYFLRVYGLEASTILLRIALLLLAAGWFYRCGPRIQRFFSSETTNSPLVPASNHEPSNLEP